ncbi:MAG: hypothetical protein ABH827_03245 [bacterium]
MPFWLHDPRPISFARQIASNVRLLCSFVFLTLITLSWFFLAQAPLNIKTTQNLCSHANLAQQRIIFTSAIKHFNEILQKRDFTNSEFKKLITNTTQQTTSLDKLLNAIKTSNLACKNIQKLSHKKRTLFDKEYLSLRITGNFENFISFFSALKKQNSCIKFKKYEFTHTKNNTLVMNAAIRLINLAPGAL